MFYLWGYQIDIQIICKKGPFIKYVSTFEGGGVFGMLTLADMGEGGYPEC